MPGNSPQDVAPREPSGAPRPASAAATLALAVILAGGLALRLWGLDYGLPHPMARPDEEVIRDKIVGFDRGDFNPRWFMYPSLTLYLLYGWVKALLAGAHAVGLHPELLPLAETVRMHPARLYLLARLLSALLGTATIALTFLLGRTLWNVRAGLIAALMLSVAMLHVRDSHFFKPEAALGLFTTAALLACVRLERSGSWRTAAEAGVLTGLALGVKQSPAPLVPLGLAALLARGRPPTAARPSTRLLVAGAATAATVVLTTPYMILDYRRFAGWMAFTRLLIQSSGEGIGTGLRYHVEHSWLLAQGPLLSLSTLAALVWQVTERRLFLVNAFVLVSLLQLGTSALAYTRYLTPVLPPLCIITATGLDRLLSRVTRARLRGLLTAVVLAGLLGRPLYASLRFDQIAAEPDTRLLARAWLEAHVPAGTPVLVLGAPWPYTFGDPDLTGYRVRRNPTLDPSVGIRYVVVHEHPIRFSRPPDGFAALAPSLRLETTISPFEGEAVPPGTVFETHDAFYVPLWGFRGVVRGGPIIRIYSVVAP